MPQSARIRPALTEPIFGSAKKDVAHSRRAHILGRLGKDLRQLDPSRRELLLQLRSRRPILLANRNARRRCSRDPSGTLAFASPPDTRLSLGAAAARLYSRTRPEMRHATSEPVAVCWKRDRESARTGAERDSRCHRLLSFPHLPVIGRPPLAGDQNDARGPPPLCGNKNVRS